jgi:hypothetical protein
MAEIIHAQEYASIILGRDVLNQLHLALVGTANTTEVFL